MKSISLWATGLGLGASCISLILHNALLASISVAIYVVGLVLEQVDTDSILEKVSPSKDPNKNATQSSKPSKLEAISEIKQLQEQQEKQIREVFFAKPQVSGGDLLPDGGSQTLQVNVTLRGSGGTATGSNSVPAPGPLDGSGGNMFGGNNSNQN
jgi:hypothetical protein